EYDSKGQPISSKAVYAGNEDTAPVLSTNIYFDGLAPFQSFKTMLRESIDALGTRSVYDYYPALTYDPTDSTKVIGRFGDIKTVTTIDPAGIELSQTESQYDTDG